jgi:hypothetical protein
VDRRLLQRYSSQGVGMSSKAYAYLLGIVAMCTGVATMVFGPSELIDTVGLAVVLGGLGAAAWAGGGNSLLRNYVLALLITALFSGVIELLALITRV